MVMEVGCLSLPLATVMLAPLALPVTTDRSVVLLLLILIPPPVYYALARLGSTPTHAVVVSILVQSVRVPWVSTHPCVQWSTPALTALALPVSTPARAVVLT